MSSTPESGKPTAPSQPVIQYVSLADQAYEALLSRISSGEYPPGHVLRELDLVAQLGVSRTPIREALLRLSEYGLLSMRGRSARVRQITRDEVVHIFQIRKSLEMTAIGLACGRLTPEDFALLDELTPKDRTALDEPSCARFDRQLHLMIALRSGNPILLHEVRRFLDVIQLAHKQLGESQKWLSREVEEHLAIIAALKAEDRKQCRLAMRRHLRSACRTNVDCAQSTTAQGQKASTNP